MVAATKALKAVAFVMMAPIALIVAIAHPCNDQIGIGILTTAPRVGACNGVIPRELHLRLRAVRWSLREFPFFTNTKVESVDLSLNNLVDLDPFLFSKTTLVTPINLRFNKLTLGSINPFLTTRRC